MNVPNTEEGLAFFEQNDHFAAGLTEGELGLIDDHAEHHAGGLYVLMRYLGEADGHEYMVKAHDSWGGADEDGKEIIVHVYSPTIEDDDGGHVTFYATGSEALRAFLSATLNIPSLRKFHREELASRIENMWRAGLDLLHYWTEHELDSDILDADTEYPFDVDLEEQLARMSHAIEAIRTKDTPEPDPEPEHRDQHYMTLGELRRKTAHLPDDMPVTAGGIGDKTEEWLNVELSDVPTGYDPSGETNDAMSLVLELREDFDTRQW